MIHQRQRVYLICRPHRRRSLLDPPPSQSRGEGKEKIQFIMYKDMVPASSVSTELIILINFQIIPKFIFLVSNKYNNNDMNNYNNLGRLLKEKHCQDT